MTASASKKRRLAIALGALLAAAAVGGGFWALRPQKPRYAPETVAVVQRETLAVIVSETGRIEPLTQVQLKAKVAGQVARVLVKEGQAVRAGQVLLELDPQDFRRQLDQAEAEKAMVAAELAELRAGARPDEVAEAQATFEAAEADRVRAEQDLARARAAAAGGTVTPRELQAAEAEARAAQARAEGAEAALHRVRTGPRSETIAQARARLRKAEVAVAGARDQLAYSVIRAPMSGTVLRKGIEVGEMVTPGVSSTGSGTPLMTIADLSKLVVEASLNQIDMGKLKPGLPVTARVDALGGREFHGRLTKISPAAVAGAEKDVRLFPIQALIESAEGAGLRPGMSADLDIRAVERPNALTLPVEAVVKDGGGRGHVALLPAGDGKPERRDVELGASSDTRVEIRGGLDEGARVLIDPASAAANVNRF